MKSKLLIPFLYIVTMFTSSAQNNPVENVSWEHWYQYTHNFFQLQWEEPVAPHNELLGYNIYRDDELYRFQTETSLYNIDTPLYGIVTNCGEGFLQYTNPDNPEVHSFTIHVTAVYAPGNVESGYLQSFFEQGLLLNTTAIITPKALLFPNPTTGFLTIGNENVTKIVVYDVSGKVIREFTGASQIDLSSVSKGLYFIKLFSEEAVIMDRIIVQ